MIQLCSIFNGFKCMGMEMLIIHYQFSGFYRAKFWQWRMEQYLQNGKNIHIY